MSPRQDRSTPQRKQSQGKGQKTRRRSRQPRSRECLLKGCGKRFRPTHPIGRYCSEECRRKARQWSQWKSRQRWRRSENGRKKRLQQSVRHRERLRMTGRALSGRKAVRVGHHKLRRPRFFWPHLRPSGLLRMLRTDAAVAVATILLARVPARVRTRVGAGTPLEGARPGLDHDGPKRDSPSRITAVMSPLRTSRHIVKAATFS